MESPYGKEIQIAIGAVRAAALLSQAILSAKDKGVTEKDDLSPVTIGDFAIQALLASTITNAFPSDGLVGEESAAELRHNDALRQRVWDLLQSLSMLCADEGIDAGQDSCKAPTSPQEMCDLIDLCGSGDLGGPGTGRVWVFDPIDGTKTFVKGEMYAINVAMLEGGSQVVGVVGCPTLSRSAQGPVHNGSVDPAGEGCILFAAKGHGTWVQPLFPKSTTAPDERLRPTRLAPHALDLTPPDLRSVSCVNVLDSGVDAAHDVVAKRLKVAFPGCDLLGWVPRWAVLALGLANMTVWIYKSRKRYAKVWDHAGAMLLFEEVGGKITDVDGRDIDLRAGRKLSANYGFVAAPKNLHDIVLETVQEVLQERGDADKPD